MKILQVIIMYTVVVWSTYDFQCIKIPTSICKVNYGNKVLKSMVVHWCWITSLIDQCTSCIIVVYLSRTGTILASWFSLIKQYCEVLVPVHVIVKQTMCWCYYCSQYHTIWCVSRLFIPYCCDTHSICVSCSHWWCMLVTALVSVNITWQHSPAEHSIGQP